MHSLHHNRVIMFSELIKLISGYVWFSSCFLSGVYIYVYTYLYSRNP